MKKALPTIILSSLFMFPSMALASDQNLGGGFKGPDGTAKVTVAEALKMRDDAKVTLTGKIVKRLGPEKYEFSDGSGNITVEIENEDWRGLNVSPEDTVLIHGEVDREFNRREIDVKSISKL